MLTPPRPIAPPALAPTLSAAGRRRDPWASPIVLIALAALAGAGCDDGSGGPGGEDGGAGVDPAEVACEATMATPMDLVAAEDHPGSSPGLDPETVPAVLPGPDPYRVAVPASGTGYLRLVTTEADEEVVLFLGNTSVLTEVYDETGVPRGVVSAGANPFCPADIPDHFDLDFQDAGTYFLEFTSAAEVWLLVSEGAGHTD